MASSVIHIVIADKVNNVLKRNKKAILIGSIAPDISKHLGQTKEKSHFLDNVDNNIPNIDKFLSTYKEKLDDDFVLGYYIHLYTDYLWFKYFYPDFVENEYIYKLDGTKEKVDEEKLIEYFYNDYTNLNIKIIDEYNMDLKIFYESHQEFKNIINEIPMNKIDLIIEKAGIIIENSKIKKDYAFNFEIVKKFIEDSTDYIISNLKDIGVIK